MKTRIASVVIAIISSVTAINLGACVTDSDTEWELRGLETPQDKRKCTYTQGWYKNHNIYAKQANRRIAWPIAETTRGCGDVWYTWMNTPPRGDAWLIFVHQWMTAQMNRKAGARPPQEVIDALEEGSFILRPCAVEDEDREYVLELAALLDDYNNGLIGPGHCDDQVIPQ